MATIRNRNGRWHVQIRKANARSLSRTFTYRKDAELWVRESEREIELGSCVRSRKEMLNDTLEDLFARYEREIGVHKKSHAVERYYVRRILEQPFGKIPLHQLTPADIQTWIDGQRKTHKPSSIARSAAFLSSVLNLAIRRWQYPMQNPLAMVGKPAVKPPSVTRISKGVLEALYKPDSLVGWLVVFALETAMRRGEILSLTWRDIDKDKRLAYLRDTKNGHPRLIPLTDKALEAISHGDTDNEYIFPMTGNAVRLAWERLKRRHGIEGVRFHDLRHEAISRFFDMGLTVPEVASISGHRTVSMLFRYAHADIEVVRKRMTNKKV
jgi:integrase